MGMEDENGKWSSGGGLRHSGLNLPHLGESGVSDARLNQGVALPKYGGQRRMCERGVTREGKAPMPPAIIVALALSRFETLPLCE